MLVRGPVEIAAQTLLDISHRKDPPHFHAWPTHGLVDTGKNVLIQERKQPLPKPLVAEQRLEAQQQDWSAVPGREVQLDGLDANLIELQLRVAYLPRACFAKNCKNRPDWRKKSPQPALPAGSLRRE